MRRGQHNIRQKFISGLNGFRSLVRDQAGYEEAGESGDIPGRSCLLTDDTVLRNTFDLEAGNSTRLLVSSDGQGRSMSILGLGLTMVSLQSGFGL